MGKFQDLTGQQFNQLTVMYRSPSRNGKTYWHCECECGNETDVWAPDLKSGHTKSCGCYKKRTCLNNIPNAVLTMEDREKHIGEQHGKLTIIGIAEEKNEKGRYLYKCQCSCELQNIKYVDYHSLTSGHTSSCGCMVSKGEYKIENLLKKNNISYEKQKIFEGLPCKRFDFYVNNQYVIEYDGKQHFISYSSGWSSEEQLKNTQENDRIKNQYCFDNNIPIIRIPYTYYDKIELEDLLLETSNFKI